MYSIIVAMNTQFPTMVMVTCERNLIDEYKNAVITKTRFLTWEKGCIEMKNVLGVFAS